MKGLRNDQKKNNISQRTKATQYLIKKSKNKEPRKSSKVIGKNFEFSKLYEESKWQKILKTNFVFSPFENNYIASSLQHLS